MRSVALISEKILQNCIASINSPQLTALDHTLLRKKTKTNRRQPSFRCSDIFSDNYKPSIQLSPIFHHNLILCAILYATQPSLNQNHKKFTGKFSFDPSEKLTTLISQPNRPSLVQFYSVTAVVINTSIIKRATFPLVEQSNTLRNLCER